MRSFFLFAFRPFHGQEQAPLTLLIAEKNRVASEIAIPGSTAAVQTYQENANNNNNDDNSDAMEGGKFKLSIEADPALWLKVLIQC